MSQTENEQIDTGRTREEKLKALVRKDVSPETTRLAKNALQKLQEGDSS